MPMKLIITRREICKYVGENSNDFISLIKNRDLPAYRTKPNSTWKARVEDLNLWIDKQAERYLKRE